MSSWDELVVGRFKVDINVCDGAPGCVNRVFRSKLSLFWLALVSGNFAQVVIVTSVSRFRKRWFHTG